jgi:purine-nucleoside phosphorylase
MELPEWISESKNYLRDQGVSGNIDTAIILGSGLGNFSLAIKNATVLPYSGIPHFPEPSVKGHSGALIWGEVGGKNILAFSGRFHFYEGFTFHQTALPVYIAQALNARKLIISNSAGGINTNFQIGDLMIIESIIRLNAAASPTNKEAFRYEPFSLADKSHKLAAELELPIRRGTYLYAKGPSYETKAEIRAFRKIGADAVGMSTVPELFEAARCRLKTAAVSLITNMAAGIRAHKLNHEEVKQAAKLYQKDFERLVRRLIVGL